MSLNVQQITLDLEKHKFLGISIVGQNNESGDGGIYIGSIMKGGAVAADGRIEAGDMLLQGIGFIVIKHRFACKVGCVIPMVVSSEFCMVKY